ncbi:hypothetical protein AN958_01062 [Leucoagaricus sp. SymC.cos]|nr:hypothetical protein AN958_01062 [Leucoagaricus sp. SymC.cos]
MALLAAAPEPMNATTNHSKIRVGITLPGENVLAGRYVTGKMEVECKSDKLGIGIIMVELFAFQELTSRDHSARMTFLHSRRLFQGPNLPPSNAVYAFPIPGDTDTPTLPEDYYKAKRGTSTFLFRIPLPLSSPASINFANGLAGVRYEVRGSVGVFWKGEKQLVMDKDEVGVLESYSEDLFGFGVGSRVRAEEGVVVVGENGRFWMHARIVGGLIVAGESACVELQVKNHSSRKNSGLVVALNRNLVLPSPNAKPSPLQISDTILTVPFKGQEYILPPGGEGVAHLVFDVPLSARSVRGGEYEGDGDEEGRKSDALFSIQASVEVKVVMGLGSKDIVVEIPVTVVHPSALPELPPQPRTSEPMLVHPQYTSIPPAPHPEQQYIDPNTQQIWIPPPGPYHNQYYQQPEYYSPQAVHSPPQLPLIYPQHQHQNAYTPLNLNLAPTAPRQLPARPSSAGPSMTTSPGHGAVSPTPNHNRYKTSPGQGEHSPSQAIQGDREEGKGVVASRISKHLRQSSVQQGRGRSVSPVAHRFGYPASSTIVGGGVGAAVIGVDGLLVVDSGDVPNDAGGDRGAGGDPILHSPRPQIRHKHSFTSGLGVVANRTGGNGKEVVMMVRSESVVELEKIAAGLSEDNNDNGVVKPHISISTSTDALDVVMDVNKTLPPPPIATKPRQRDSPGNAAALELLLDSPSPSPLPRISSSQDLGTRDILPPTPTLMAVKRPSKLAVPVNSGTVSDSGSGSGERRLQAQVGTRKPEKEKKPDVRNILTVNSNSNTRPKLQSLTLPTTAAATVAAGIDEVLREGNRTPTYTNVDSSVPPSTSSTPNPEGGKLRNGTTDGREHEEREYGEEMEMEMEQESVDGGKTHRAGKSVVGVESYVQSRHHQLPPPQQQYGQHKRTSAIINSPSPSRPYSSSKSSSQRPSTTTTTTTTTTPKKHISPSTSTTSNAAKSKKSAQTRGRVTAWLGKIDPDAPPPQEQIIPPSPSVVKPVEWEEIMFGGGDEGKEKGRERNKSRIRTNAACPRSRSRSRSPPPFQPPELVSSPPPAQTLPPPTRIRTISQTVSPPSPSPVVTAGGGRTAASPNPRSSGFMPIETMKAQRDTITKTMSRSIGREASVVKEARRVMDIWSEDLPSSSSSPTTQQKQQEVEEGKKNVNANVKKYPLMVPSPPKTQSIRTDRRVSPPSVATISGGGGGAAAATAAKRSIPQVIEPKSIPTSAPPAPSVPASSTTIAPTVPSPNVIKPTNQRLTPSPISYANVAASCASASPTSTSATAAQPVKEKKLLNQNQRSQLPPPPQKLSVFPAPPPPASQQQQRQDQQEGNKYDVKSARGGRGGQVTHVASLWASVAAGNAGGGDVGGKVGAGAGTGVKKDVKGVGMMSTATPATTGSNVDNDDVKMKKPVNGPPLLLPKKPSFTTVVASSPSTSTGETMAERIRLRSKTPTPSSSSKPAKKSTAPSASTSKPISKSPTPPSTTNSRPDKPKGTPPSLPTINAMAKPTSVPALVSSSLATPTLSSTASLVRPVGRSGSRTATVPVGIPGIGKGDYKSAVVGGGREGGSGEGGVNGVKVGGAVRKRSTGLGVVGEEHGAQAQTQMKSKVVSPGQGMVSTPIAAVGLPKPNAAAAVASLTPAEGMDNVKRPPSRELAFGQARLRDLIKKYQEGDA